MPDREFDLVVLGSTGVTGRQVLRYLADRADSADVRWAVAGRDQARIEEGLAAIGLDVPVLVVDLLDHAPVDELARRTRVVANLVGPYARYGQPVYEACADAGTHQVDVCGEVDWLRDRIAQLHAVAEHSGARIVTTAGFEALPFDLAALMAAEVTLARWDEPLADMDVAITVDRDPPVMLPVDLVSGGTLVSGADAIRRGAHAATGDARLLDETAHDPLPFDLAPRRHPATGAWLGPLVPSPYINPVIAHRTAALTRNGGAMCFDDSYRFRDGLVTAGLFPAVPDAIAAGWLSAAQAAGSLLTTAPEATRGLVADLMERLGPVPGQGPDDARLEGWSWRLDGRATTVSGRTLDVVVEGEGHPGYRSTGNLVGEAALLLAEGGDDRGGIVTPAIAFGTTSIPRFESAGVTMAVSP